jgi:glycogen phosphorylase
LPYLVESIRSRDSKQKSVVGAFSKQLESEAAVFDPNTLTLGFARRFATYKRPNLLLRDSERLIRILTNTNQPFSWPWPERPTSRIMQGQEMIRQWVLFTLRDEFRGRVVFLSDYDMLLAEELVQGVDVWINTPRRPWEACGTSGMKILVNGGLNLSSLDGWWEKAYNPSFGWSIGDLQNYTDESAQDAVEADSCTARWRVRSFLFSIAAIPTGSLLSGLDG